jgi:hypothetical protein
MIQGSLHVYLYLIANSDGYTFQPITIILVMVKRVLTSQGNPDRRKRPALVLLLLTSTLRSGWMAVPLRLTLVVSIR